MEARLAVSNITWPEGGDDLAMGAIAQHGVRHIDVVPAKAFPVMKRVGADGVDRQDLVDFRRSLRVHDMQVSGFQSVTFGRTENFVTGTAEERRDLRHHMQGIIHLAEFVGARTIVYGGGSTRSHDGLSAPQVSERAAEFFGHLDRVATDAGVVLGIEPVSTAYTGGRPVFGRTGSEVVDFASSMRQEYSAESTAFVPDTFAMHDGGDDVQSVFMQAAANKVLAPHMQISEPGMAVHGLGSAIRHTDYAREVRYAIPSLAEQYAEPPIIAIENFAPPDGVDPVAQYDRSVPAAYAHYAQVLTQQ